MDSIRQSLIDWFRPLSSCLVAFSGGLDSTVVAKAAATALGESALAVMAESPSCRQGEVDQARAVAETIPIRFVAIQSDEMEDPDYTSNGPERCYVCKKIRFRELTRYAAEHQIETIVDGSHRDDRDDFRPGMKAVREFGIRSPLSELDIDKPTVRRLARSWSLPNSEKPASPCLSTRLSYGLEITEERLRSVEAAEDFLASLGFSPIRVRLHPGNLVRIEVAPEQISMSAEPSTRSLIVDRFRALGFDFVALDLQGFRSGSMNVF